MYLLRPDDSWSSLWRTMRLAGDNDINLRSNCPWTYVKDGSRFRPELFNVVKYNCIDLDRSTEDRLYPTMNGVCTPVRDSCPTSRAIVGFTCMKLIETETVKRNEVVDPWHHVFPAFSKTTIKPDATTKIDNGADEKDDDEDKKSHTTPLHQMFVPPFNNPSNPFYSPSFLVNNNAQFQPGFLNTGMNPQIGQPPLMLQFGVNQSTKEESMGEEQNKDSEKGSEILNDEPEEIEDYKLTQTSVPSTDYESHLSKRHSGDNYKTFIRKLLNDIVHKRS